jgi:N-acetylglucosamine-6-phosphate deacetylase
MAARLRRLAELREQDPFVGRIIVGLHIEGPFINETDGYRGAHPFDAVRPTNVDEMLRLLEAAGGLARIVTLAPERDPGLQITRRLSKEGVVVSAGHSNATLDELKAAIDSGLSMFTHLGNGCPMQMHRHDNIVQRVLSLNDRLWVTFIADGAHVPLFALKNYLDIVGLERAIIVTDAIAPAGLGPGDYTISRWRLRIGEDLVARAPDGSHLVGAAMGLPRVAENLRSVGLSDDDIERVTFRNPKRAIRMT